MPIIEIEASNLGGLTEGVNDTPYPTIQSNPNATFYVGNNQAYEYVGQMYQLYTGPPQYYCFYIDRPGLVFDISSLSGKTALTATISLFGNDDASYTDFDVTLISGNDLADTLIAADYGELLNDVTSYGSFNTSSFILEAWNTITLNAEGLVALQAAIDGGSGKFRLGIRSSRDISATTPKLNGDNYYGELVAFYGNTANKKPKLKVTVQSQMMAGLPPIFMKAMGL